MLITLNSPYITVLGVTQDGGFPHINNPTEFDDVAKGKQSKELVVSLGLLDGVFLTHAHMGHYTGLMHFGREAMGAKDIPVYAMPRMQLFLETNGNFLKL